MRGSTAEQSTKATVLILLAGLLGSCAGGHFDESEMVYVAVGASDAFGIGATPVTNGYVFKIKDELEDQDREVALVNLGIPGANIDRINDAVRIFLRTGVTADLVTVWVGANDLIDGVDVDNFEGDLEELLDRLQGGMESFVVIANLPDLTRLPRFIADPDKDVSEDRLAAFNQIIQTEADDRDIPLVDLFAEGIEPDLVSDIDGFHPNDAGHERLAELFLEVIGDEL